MRLKVKQFFFVENIFIIFSLLPSWMDSNP
jgi:hypothetical protein